MDYSVEAITLSRFARTSPALYVRTEPEIVDFTVHEGGNLIIMIQGESLQIPFRRKSIKLFIGFLDAMIFSKDIPVIGWNIKTLFSYLKFYGQEPQCNNKLLDIKLAEAYHDKRDQAPITFQEAVRRLQNIDKTFLKGIYKKIHIPLITKVIPTIETNSLVDLEMKTHVYPYYEIEGQANGRMKCFKGFKKCIDPHTMSPQQKENLKLVDDEEVFVYLDYKNMEASILAYLSQDPALMEILENKGDFYEQVYSLVTNSPCDTLEKRDQCKLIFLPIVFGQSPRGLADELNITYNEASHMVSLINDNFSISMKWLKEQQEQGEVAQDVFGRIRNFKNGQHRIRNFVIQAPSAMVCLEKLIQLHDTFKNNLCLHIHDGYILRCNINKCIATTLKARKILESGSELCPGLELRVSCSIGKRLSKMKKL